MNACIFDDSTATKSIDAITLTSISKIGDQISDSTKLYYLKFDYELSSIDYADFNIKASSDNGKTFKKVDGTQYQKGKGSSGTYLQITKSLQGGEYYGKLDFSTSNSNGEVRILATTSAFILP